MLFLIDLLFYGSSTHRIGSSRELLWESSNTDQQMLKRFRLQIGSLKWQFAI